MATAVRSDALWLPTVNINQPLLWSGPNVGHVHLTFGSSFHLPLVDPPVNVASLIFSWVRYWS